MPPELLILSRESYAEYRQNRQKRQTESVKTVSITLLLDFNNARKFRMISKTMSGSAYRSIGRFGTIDTDDSESPHSLLNRPETRFRVGFFAGAFPYNDKT